MRMLTLDTGVTGLRPVSLDGPAIYAGPASGLRSIEWAYRSGTRRLTGAGRSPREMSLDVECYDRRLLDRLSEAFDAAMALGRPMTLTADGQWRARVYVPKTETQSVTPRVVAQEWTLILLDGVWTRLGPVLSFNPRTTTGSGLDMGFDLAPSGSR